MSALGLVVKSGSVPSVSSRAVRALAASAADLAAGLSLHSQQIATVDPLDADSLRAKLLELSGRIAGISRSVQGKRDLGPEAGVPTMLGRTEIVVRYLDSLNVGGAGPLTAVQVAHLDALVNVLRTESQALKQPPAGVVDETALSDSTLHDAS